MVFDRKTYFDSVRQQPFGGSLTEEQVSGQEAILTGWETYVPGADPRWLAYMLATTMHETGATMQPVEEYGKGEGMEYGEPDPETSQTYYGRGFVQLTWRENYARADDEIGLSEHSGCEWHADNALEPSLAARIMWFGMTEGWFRSDNKGAQTLLRYFNEDDEDPYGAREIINGDKHIVPDWSHGLSIGQIVESYYGAFLAALDRSAIDDEPLPEPQQAVTIAISAPKGVQVLVIVNDVPVATSEPMT